MTNSPNNLANNNPQNWILLTNRTLHPIKGESNSIRKLHETFLISNFRRVLSIVCSLLSISAASDYWMPTFRNTLYVPSSKAEYEVWIMVDWKRTRIYTGDDVYWRWWDQYFTLHIQPLKMEQIKCSETSAFNNQTPGKYPKDYTQFTKHVF